MILFYAVPVMVPVYYDCSVPFQTNPLLSLNYSIFMGNFRKNWSNCTNRPPWPPHKSTPLPPPPHTHTQTRLIWNLDPKILDLPLELLLIFLLLQLFIFNANVLTFHFLSIDHIKVSENSFILLVFSALKILSAVSLPAEDLSII